MAARSRQSDRQVGAASRREGSAEVITRSAASPVENRPLSERNGPPKPGKLAGTIENLLILLFIVLTAVGIFHHELWRDETQSWLIARDSTSLIELFRNTHYEGHPLLWHYCLYGLSRISRNPLIMQGFNLLLAVGTVTLLVKKSPFSLLQRGLMVLGYFTLYEYALLARSYGLGVFLTFLFCTLYCQRKPKLWAMTLVLVLLANTSLLGLVMSLTLAIAPYYRLVFSPEQRKSRRLSQRLSQRIGRRREIQSDAVPGRPLVQPMSVGWPLTALFLGWGLSLAQIARSLINPLGLAGFASTADTAPDAATSAMPAVTEAIAAATPTQIENLNKLLQIVLKSYLPLPTFSFHFWNGHLFEAQALRPDVGLYVLLLSGGLVFVALLTAVRLLSKTPLFLTLYLTGSLAMMSLFVFVHRGSTRHYGHLFILLLACLWLAYASQGQRPRRAFSVYPLIFTGLLGLQALSGLYAYGSDILFPFSASYQTAQIIQANQLTDLPILGINQRPVSPLSGYLDRPIYYPESKQLGSFWDISYPELKKEGAVVEAVASFAAAHPSFIAVLSAPLAVEQLRDSSALAIDYLAYIGPSIVEDEAFYLYQISQTVSQPASE